MWIAHPTDLTGDDSRAFVHAAALAAINGGRLVTLYAGNDRDAAAPDVGALATRWERSIDHEFRHVERDDDVSDTLISTLRELRPAMIVVGTHARHGLAALLRGSIGEAIARNVEMPVLVVPNQGRGFVTDAGAIELRRIVIPASGVDAALRGTEAARALLALTRTPEATIELLHVGPIDHELDALGATRVEGDLEEAIVGAVQLRDACMVVMPTHGHDGVGDVLRGSHTERVIRDVGCPVLSVPI